MFKYIKAQVSSRRGIEDSLDNHTVVILEHLAYLYVFGDVQDRDHWRRDIRKNMHAIPKARIGAKVRYLTPQEILNATFNQHCSDYKLQAILDSAPYDKPEYQADYIKLSDLETYKNLCYQYFNWLSVKLSKEGYVSSSSCFAKLEELGL